MYRSRSSTTRPQKLRGKRNVSDDSEDRARLYEEISRLVAAGMYHIPAIDLGRRMLAYYSSRDS